MSHSAASHRDLANLSQALSLPRLSRQQAYQCSLVAAATGTASFAFGTVPVSVGIAPAEHRTAHLYAWRLDLVLGSHPLSLHCTQALVSRLLRTLEPALTLDPPPSPSTLALLVDTLVHPLATAWQRTLGCELKLTNVVSGPPPPQDAVDLRVDVAGERHQAVLSGPAMVQLLAAWPKQLHALSDWHVPAWLRLGTTWLPAHILASLRSGDAVLIETVCAPNAELQFAGGWEAATRTVNEGVALLERPAARASRETRMPSGEGTDIEALPIRLDFDVGHRDIALAELRMLQPGSVITLGRPATELVEITVHGRRIGTGELVQIEGAVAVRIKQLFGLG